MAKKTTILDGYYATGDHECFVFDRQDDPESYYEIYGDDIDARIKAQKENRVYPDSLLPAWSEGKKGKWTITVEFEPSDS